MAEFLAAAGSLGALGFGAVAIVLAFMLIKEIRGRARTSQLLAATEDARERAVEAIEAMRARVDALEMAVTDLGVQLDEKDQLIAELTKNQPGVGRKIFDAPPTPSAGPKPLPPPPRTGGRK